VKVLNGFALSWVDFRYDFMAFKTNALIIPACGFDSVPPDLAVFVANRYVKAVLGPGTSIEDSVTAYDVRGGFSGGSTDSIISSVEGVPRETLVRSTADYVLRHRKSCVHSFSWNNISRS
jgi:short subunit dehydrogenase-like uncharacterized protein